ncbi:hypothetical protein KJ780_04145 [Candidatus Micrarchaeota archaeon]|nr:hypothetical protein [Candidatus Micrarchaeota archaeon]
MQRLPFPNALNKNFPLHPPIIGKKPRLGGVLLDGIISNNSHLHLKPLELAIFFRNFKAKSILLIPHTVPDTDAIVSAFVLSMLFSKSKIFISGSPTAAARQILNGLISPNLIKLFFPNISRANLKCEKTIANFVARNKRLFTDSPNLSRFQGAVVIDTAQPDRIPILKNLRILAVIKHRKEPGNGLHGECFDFQHEASSTAELLSELITPMDRLTAYLLARAILADTDALRHDVSSYTLHHYLAQLCISGIDHEHNVKTVLDLKKTGPGHLLSFIEVVRKTCIERIDGYEVALVPFETGNSNGSMRQNDVAKAVVEFAHLVIVAGWNQNDPQTQVSIRHGYGFPIPAKTIADALTAYFGGDAGGHNKAAGGKINAPRNDVLEFAAKYLKDELNK